MHHVLAAGALAALLLTPVVHAAAGPRPCGDNVRGHPVPCRCGDVLVGSRRLTAADPITRNRCEGDGLLVRLGSVRDGATLDLAGYEIAGTGRGVGIRVAGGGAGRLTIVGPGVVREFDTGILATAGVDRIEGVAVRGNTADGMRLAGAGFALIRCEAIANGRHGFALRGVDYVLDGNRAAENSRHGFVLTGRRGTIGLQAGNTADGNGGTGVVIAGQEHAIDQPVAIGNGALGVRARIARSRIRRAVTRENRSGGLRATAHDSAVGPVDAAEPAPVSVRGARRVEP